MNWVYTLSDDEFACAEVVTDRRQRLNNGNGFEGTALRSGVQRDRHQLQGVMSEIGVSRVLNLSWSGCGNGTKGLADVGDRYEVRSVDELFKGLLVNGHDRHKERVYILVHFTLPQSVKLIGWAVGDDVVKIGVGRGLDGKYPYWVLGRDKLKSMDVIGI